MLVEVTWTTTRIERRRRLVETGNEGFPSSNAFNDVHLRNMETRDDGEEIRTSRHVVTIKRVDVVNIDA